MKRWIKGMLIVSAVCVGTGTVLGVCAWAMGGRFSYFRHRRYGLVQEATEEEAEWTPPTERETAPAADMGTPPDQEYKDAGSAQGQAENSGGTAPAAVRQLEFDGKIITELDITVEGAKVEVTADEAADTIQIICDDDIYRCDQGTDKDTLKIRVRRRSDKDQSIMDFLSQWDEEPTAQIIIPANMRFAEADLEVAGGILTVGRISADKLDLDLQGGKLEVMSGNAAELKGECKAGELIYEGQVEREADAECKAGAIEYLLEGREEDFNYEIETSLGMIAINGAERGDLKNKSVLSHPGAVKKMELECKAGSIMIDFYQQ